MKRKHLLLVVNCILVAAMVIHVAIAWYLHAQCPANSAPAWTTMIYSIYYLIPMAVINTVYVIVCQVRKNRK